jgi:hypothetical protein
VNVHDEYPLSLKNLDIIEEYTRAEHVVNRCGAFSAGNFLSPGFRKRAQGRSK